MSNFNRSPNVLGSKHKSPRACRSLNQALMIGDGAGTFGRQAPVLRRQLIRDRCSNHRLLIQRDSVANWR